MTLRAKHTGPAGYVASVQNAIPGAGVLLNARGIALTLTCRLCGPIDAYVARNRVPPEAIVKTLRARGWALGKSAAKHLCPKPHQEEQSMPDKLSARIVASHVVEPVLENSPAASAAKLAALDWLRESFKNGRFTRGINDETISKEVGLSESAVAQLRKEFLGDIREPTEIEELRNELTAIAKARFDMDGQFNRQINELVARENVVREKIDALAAKNGWKS